MRVENSIPLLGRGFSLLSVLVCAPWVLGTLACSDDAAPAGAADSKESVGGRPASTLLTGGAPGSPETPGGSPSAHLSGGSWPASMGGTASVVAAGSGVVSTGGTNVGPTGAGGSFASAGASVTATGGVGPSGGVADSGDSATGGAGSSAIGGAVATGGGAATGGAGSSAIGGAVATGGGAATGGDWTTGGSFGSEGGASGGAPPGTAGVAESGGGGSGGGGQFELAWEDEFDTVDSSRWTQMTHSWDGNLAQFSTSNTVAEDGILKLALTAAPAGSEKPYLGVEYRSVDTLTFGKVEARVRFAKGSAVVSSLVLIYTPWPPDDWNELDIECLGQSTREVQFNHMINIPPAAPETGHLQFPRLVDLGFDPTADFHVFTIEWVPGVARFIVDGELHHEATEEMSRMVLPQNILLTIWASDSADWAGPVDTTTVPTSADYDWIRVYRYVGQ